MEHSNCRAPSSCAKGYFAERNDAQLNAEKPPEIIKMQKSVMLDTADNDLMHVLEKVVLNVFGRYSVLEPSEDQAYGRNDRSVVVHQRNIPVSGGYQRHHL